MASPHAARELCAAALRAHPAHQGLWGAWAGVAAGAKEREAAAREAEARGVVAAAAEDGGRSGGQDAEAGAGASGC